MYLFCLRQESEEIATNVPVLLVEEGGGQTKVTDTPSSPNPAAARKTRRENKKFEAFSSVFATRTACSTNTI